LKVAANVLNKNKGVEKAPAGQKEQSNREDKRKKTVKRLIKGLLNIKKFAGGQKQRRGTTGKRA